MHTLLDMLALPEAAAAVVAAIGLAFGWLLRRESVRQHNLERAVQCLETGVRETYEEFVRARKAARADGKLTDRERAEAVERALARAAEVAARGGIDLAAAYARDYLPVLVDRIVRARKSSPPSAMREPAAPSASRAGRCPTGVHAPGSCPNEAPWS